jgi:hypothetical protein
MIPFNGSEWIGIENSLRILADGLLNSKAKVLAEERPKTRLGPIMVFGVQSRLNDERW